MGERTTAEGKSITAGGGEDTPVVVRGPRESDAAWCGELELNWSWIEVELNMG
jgi:hypothetical protein